MSSDDKPTGDKNIAGRPTTPTNVPEIIEGQIRDGMTGLQQEARDASERAKAQAPYDPVTATRLKQHQERKPD